MSNLPSTKLYVQTEQVLTREPVSENLVQTIAASTNFTLDTSIYMEPWKLNGPIKLFNGQSSVDCIFSFPSTYNWEIFDVAVTAGTQGTGGYVEFNLEHAAFGSNSFSTIFTTRPQIYSTAGDGVSVHVGTSVSGCVAPVLLVQPYPVAGRDKIKMTVTSMQSGSPRNFSIRIYYKARN